MKKQAEKYDDIELTCVSGEGDDNKENGLLEDCITKQYDLVIVQSNNNGAQAAICAAACRCRNSGYHNKSDYTSE